MSTKLIDKTKMIDEPKIIDTNEIKITDSKNQKLKKDKTNDSQKLDKKTPIIPNTLTIYINTRIPNHNKLIYDPSMTVPNSKSHTVYFEPLIKYNVRSINNIQQISLPNLTYTQFF